MSMSGNVDDEFGCLLGCGLIVAILSIFFFLYGLVAGIERLLE